jgi:SpoVK/Ycf46/Vps4 family AAA+-type ATPase
MSKNNTLNTFRDISSNMPLFHTDISNIITKLFNDVFFELEKNSHDNSGNNGHKTDINTIKYKLNSINSNNMKTYQKYNNISFINAIDKYNDKTLRSNPTVISNSVSKNVLNNLLVQTNEDYYNNQYNNIHFSGYDISKDSFCASEEIAQGNIIENVIKERIIIDEEINSLRDLIQLTEKYKLLDDVEYNINMEAIHKIKDPLEELDRMIGMTTLKDNIVDQILYFIQDLHNIKTKNNDGDFMHTVIYGPPGTGKTEIARIMGKIYSKLGVLKKEKFKKATRSDLIAGYLGQTALKTKDLIEECLDGVLFIDEAYALGNQEKKDSFAKECIDTLCEALSNHKDRIMVIIAGYEKELNECFFNYNQGLESRFTWRFKTDDYDANDLRNIFIKKTEDCGWSILDKKDIDEPWFKGKMEYFKYYGRDMETLLAKTKVAHSRRVFCKSDDIKTKLTKRDLDKGYQLYVSNEEVISRKDDGFTNMQNMYL